MKIKRMEKFEHYKLLSWKFQQIICTRDCNYIGGICATQLAISYHNCNIYPWFFTIILALIL